MPNKVYQEANVKTLQIDFIFIIYIMNDEHCKFYMLNVKTLLISVVFIIYPLND